MFEMKNVFLILLALILTFSTETGLAQSLNSQDYFIFRSKLNHSENKFDTEQKGRVVFLGGSITFNPGWRDSVSQYIQKKFSETDFEFINAGIPSMGSTPGAFRFERDVLKNGPVDLLFVEAAVNDDTNRRTPEEIIRGMEGIVRHAKKANPSCDIVIMYFVDPGKMEDYRNGMVPDVIQLHEKVAEHYGISIINLAKEVTERIDAGEFTWETDFKDLHPSPFGQQVYAHAITSFLEKAWANSSDTEQGAEKALPEPLDKFSYDDGVLVEPNPKRKIKGWERIENWNPNDGKGTRANYIDVPMLVGEYPGKIIKFDFKGNAVGIAVAAGPDAGIIEFSIDDSEWEKQDLFTPWSTGLYLPWYYTLGSGLKEKNHILQIRLTNGKNPKSTGTKCIVRYFYFNGISE